MNKNMISLQKTNSWLLENNTKVLGNDVNSWRKQSDEPKI